jgi:hypothetical protein
MTNGVAQCCTGGNCRSAASSPRNRHMPCCRNP